MNEKSELLSLGGALRKTKAFLSHYWCAEIRTFQTVKQNGNAWLFWYDERAAMTATKCCWRWGNHHCPIPYIFTSPSTDCLIDAPWWRAGDKNGERRCPNNVHLPSRSYFLGHVLFEKRKWWVRCLREPRSLVKQVLSYCYMVACSEKEYVGRRARCAHSVSIAWRAVSADMILNQQWSSVMQYVLNDGEKHRSIVVT